MDHLLDVVAAAARDLLPGGTADMLDQSGDAVIGRSGVPHRHRSRSRIGAAVDTVKDGVEDGGVADDPYYVVEDDGMTDVECEDAEWEDLPLDVKVFNYEHDTEPPSPFGDTGGASSSSGPHPWEIATGSRGRSSNLSTEERQTRRDEQRMAELCGVPWQERGPAGRDGERPQFWRGQARRAGRDGGGQRYANRGGKNKEYYKALARSGTLVVKHTGISKGKDKGKFTGKESGKGKGKCKGKESHKGKGKSSSKD